MEGNIVISYRGLDSKAGIKLSFGNPSLGPFIHLFLHVFHKHSQRICQGFSRYRGYSSDHSRPKIPLICGAYILVGDMVTKQDK